MRRPLLCTVSFLLGLGLFAALAQRLDRLPYRTWTRAKVAASVAAEAPHDTLVFGSSRLHFGCMPAVFDAAMAERGQPRRTFNLAFSGMRPHDYGELAHWVLEHRPPQLRHVIVELMDWSPDPGEGNWLTDRQLEGHPWRRLLPRLRTIAAGNQPAWTRAERAGHAVLHTAAAMLALGQGPRVLDDLADTWLGRPLEWVEPVPDGGFVDAATVPWESMQRAHAQLLADPDARERQLAARRAGEPGTARIGRVDADDWLALHQRFREAGIEPIYVVMPGIHGSSVPAAAIAAVAQHAVVLDFADGRAHPQLFATELWHDHAHLSRRGAEVFSTLLAERVANLAPRR